MVLNMLIGEQLKERRLEKGLTIDDIQNQTKIQARHIKAIERNDFSLIPGDFYVRAFIREYAQAVGLDVEELIKEHQTELPATVNDDTRDFTRLKRSRTKATSSEKSPFQMLLPTIFVLLFIFLIGFIIYEFVLTNEDPISEDITEENPSSVADSVTIPPEDETAPDAPADEDDDSEDVAGDDAVEDDEASDQQEPSLDLTSYENAESRYRYISNEATTTLTVDTTNQNWLQIEDDAGQSLYEAMLTTSNGPVEIDITDYEFVYLRFGEPGVISIEINGEALTFSEDMNMSTVQRVWIYLNEADPNDAQ